MIASDLKGPRRRRRPGAGGGGGRGCGPTGGRGARLGIGGHGRGREVIIGGAGIVPERVWEQREPGGTRQERGRGVGRRAQCSPAASFGKSPL